MDFAFSPEQEMLRSSARSFLADKVPADRVAEIADSTEGWDEKSWREIVELGWVGLSVPEAAGGAGMGFLEEAVLFESLGEALYPGPYFSTVALAQPALGRSPERFARVMAGGTATIAWTDGGAATLAEASSVETEARADGDAWALSGTKDLVADLEIAEQVVVVARGADGVGLWAVDSDRDKVTALETMDPTRRYGRLELTSGSAELLASGDDARSLIEAIRVRALAAAALEAVGVGQYALTAAQTHATERKQFGKPIGTYQAVAHRVAEAFVEIELARSLAYWAAWCVAEGDAQAATVAPAAKARAADAAVAACEASIQVHGGIGFTWEHMLHRYYKRAQWLQSFEGFARVQRAAVADQLFAKLAVPRPDA